MGFSPALQLISLMPALKRLRLCCLTVSFLCGLSLPIFAANYEVQKIVMSGDGVPGFTDPEVTEVFRYFRAVHMFPDGSVGFAGVTTRGQSILRDAPRGIYYSGAPGSLATIAEVDNEYVWKSIGLPSFFADANNAKTYAYDFLEAENLWQAVATKPFDGEIVPLTPTDGTGLSLSGPLVDEGLFVLGNLDSAFRGITINEAGTVVFQTSLNQTVDPENPVLSQGIFRASNAEDLEVIALKGFDAPAIADAGTFFDFGSINQAENGAVFFTAQIAGPSSGNNELLYLEKDGAFSVLLREGEAAPGLPDYIINLTGNLNLINLDVRGDHAVHFSGVVGLHHLSGSRRRHHQLGRLPHRPRRDRGLSDQPSRRRARCGDRRAGSAKRRSGQSLPRPSPGLRAQRGSGRRDQRPCKDQARGA